MKLSVTKASIAVGVATQSPGSAARHRPAPGRSPRRESRKGPTPLRTPADRERRRWPDVRRARCGCRTAVHRTRQWSRAWRRGAATQWERRPPLTSRRLPGKRAARADDRDVLLPARPHELNRRADVLRDHRRLDRVVVLQSPVEAAARRHRIEHGILRHEANRFSRRGLCQRRRLRGDPQFELAAGQPRGGGRGLDRGVSCGRDFVAVSRRWLALVPVACPAGGNPACRTCRQRGVERLGDPLAVARRSSARRGSSPPVPFRRPPGVGDRRDPARVP